MAQHDLPTIDQLETTAQTDITHALRDALRHARTDPRTGSEALRTARTVADALRAASPQAADTALGLSNTAIHRGATDAQHQAPPPDGTDHHGPTAETAAQLLDDQPITRDTRTILRDTALTLGTTAPDQLLADGLMPSVEQAARRLTTYTGTLIHRAANRAHRWYARLYGYDLRWITEQDDRVCPICGPLHQTVIASQERFASQEADWESFDGQPPAHPNCRCETQVNRRGLLR